MRVNCSGGRLTSLFVVFLLAGSGLAWAAQTPTGPDTGPDTGALGLEGASPWGDLARAQLADADRPALVLQGLKGLLDARDAPPALDAATLRAQASLDAAMMLLDVLDTPDGDLDPVEVARAALLAQAERVRAVHGEPQGRNVFSPLDSKAELARLDPSVLVTLLAARHDVTLDPLQLLDAARLDQLPAAVRDALAALLAAFVAYQDADGIVAAPADLARVLVAQAGLLDAAVALGHALDAHPLLAKQSGAAFQVYPVISLDWGPGQNVYTKDFMLLVDAGGNDIFHNNAGGNAVESGACPIASTRLAAALISYGGNDRFISERGCGVNGGGHWGSGFLFNRAGANEYVAGDGGTNGGAHGIGVGFLLDAGASPTRYVAGSEGTNGGGSDYGYGLLVDGGGPDRYEGGAQGVNGGGDRTGGGLLVSLEGNDAFVAQGRGTNGGGHLEGAGILLKRSGVDSYDATDLGTNGGAAQLGTGLLVDLVGRDTYRAGDLGVNGGAATGGIGMLVTGTDDTGYLAGDRGVNGGGYVGGSGNLIDLGGDDTYESGERGVNGGASAEPHAADQVCPRLLPDCFHAPFAWGLLLDSNGNDFYVEHNVHASGHDVTVVPKGPFGAQLDL